MVSGSMPQHTESDDVRGDFTCNHISQQLCAVIPSTSTTEASYERVVGKDICFDPFGCHFVEAPIFAKTVNDDIVYGSIELDLSMFHLSDQI